MDGKNVFGVMAIHNCAIIKAGIWQWREHAPPATIITVPFVLQS